MAIPQEIAKKVVGRLFEDAENRGWVNLALPERTKMYNDWVKDSEVGGRLRDFISVEDARVWIKDGPMKEYSRARYGIGKYAQYIAAPALARQELLRSVLGDDWQEEPKSLVIKPLRVTVTDGDKRLRLTWGSARDFKHLLWAALESDAKGDTVDWVLCVVGSFENPTPADRRRMYDRMAKRCGFSIKYV